MKGCVALPPLSEYWRAQRKMLQQFLSGMSSAGSVGTVLVQALHQPLAHHVQQYVFFLLSLADTIGEVGNQGDGGAGCHFPGMSLVGKLREGRNGPLAQGTCFTQELWFEKDLAMP